MENKNVTIECFRILIDFYAGKNLFSEIKKTHETARKMGLDIIHGKNDDSSIEWRLKIAKCRHFLKEGKRVKEYETVFQILEEMFQFFNIAEEQIIIDYMSLLRQQMVLFPFRKYLRKSKQRNKDVNIGIFTKENIMDLVDNYLSKENNHEKKLITILRRVAKSRDNSIKEIKDLLDNEYSLTVFHRDFFIFLNKIEDIVLGKTYLEKYVISKQNSFLNNDSPDGTYSSTKLGSNFFNNHFKNDKYHKKLNNFNNVKRLVEVKDLLRSPDKHNDNNSADESAAEYDDDEPWTQDFPSIGDNKEVRINLLQSNIKTNRKIMQPSASSILEQRLSYFRPKIDPKRNRKRTYEVISVEEKTRGVEISYGRQQERLEQSSNIESDTLRKLSDHLMTTSSQEIFVNRSAHIKSVDNTVPLNNPRKRLTKPRSRNDSDTSDNEKESKYDDFYERSGSDLRESKRRKMRHPWTEDEVKALKKGYSKYCNHSLLWKKIKSEYSEELRDRSLCQLKDKWRNLTRKQI